MQAEAYIKRTVGRARNCGDVSSAEAHQRKMRLERCERRRTVARMKFTRESERDTVGSVDGQIGIATGLVAEQRMPGLVSGQIGQLLGRQERVEHAQKSGALRVVSKDRFDFVERIFKPLRLQVAVAVEQTYRFA